MSKTVGAFLIAAGVLVGLLGLVFLMVSGVAAGGAVLGAFLLFVVLVLPLIGGGIYVITRSNKDEQDEDKSEAMRTILSMVEARGAVSISDVVIELKSTTDDVKSMVYDLVGMGVFEGYINWNEGTLYSMEAQKLKDMTECKNCGGAIKPSGKGVFQCPFCGTEYFL